MAVTSVEQWGLLDVLTALALSMAIFGTAAELKATAKRLRPHCDGYSFDSLITVILKSSNPIAVLKRCLAELDFGTF